MRVAGPSQMWLIRHKREFCELYVQLNPDLPKPTLANWQRAYPKLARAANGACIPVRSV
jgi:hypothetical protein